MNLHQRQPRKIMSAREIAEAVFAKRAAPVAAPRILEDVPKPVVVETKRRLLGLPLAKNDNAAKAIDHAVAAIAMPATALTAIPRDETPHEKVFRLVGERKFEEAARLAKKLIDAGDVSGFFIYGSNPAFRKASDAFTDHIAKSRRGAYSEIQTITPEWAQAMLSANEDNRLINTRGLVDRLRDIVDGRWELNGQGLIIAKSGELNDGQHRLWAILLSGTPVKISVFYGAQRSTRGTLDTGKIRVTKDRFRFSGIPNDVRASAVVSLTHRILEGRDATEAEKIAYYDKDSVRFQIAVNLGNGLPKGTPVASLSAAGYLLLRAGRAEEAVKKFYREIRGVDVPVKGSASFLLFKALLEKEKGLIGKTPQQQAFTVASLYLRWETGKRAAATIQVINELPEALVI